LACSDYTIKGNGNNAGADDTAGNTGTGDSTLTSSACPDLSAPVEDCGFSDSCHYEIGGFEPVVAWAIPGTSLAMPAVVDLDGDGMPEVIANIIDSIFPVPGRLQVWAGDGSGMLWEDTTHEIAYGGHPAVADLDGDGRPEILETIQYSDNLFGAGEFSVGAWSWDGDFLGESDHFKDFSFDHATGLAISDMDHDGSPEIIAGRAILHADLSTRGIGRYGRGATMGEVGFIAEGSHPAVVDLDLDGEEEVIVGNAIYDADGNTIWADPFGYDGSPSIGNFDADPEGEFFVAYGNTYRLHDTDGSMIWGPVTIQSGNILSSPAVGDLDGDGIPEIVVAGGNELHVVRADGSIFWKARVTDQTGATGASIFDFDADGVPEVVYIDEVEMVAYNGTDGTVKFRSTEHGSVTMYDYPVIVDVNNDNHADILVANQTNNEGIVVYRDATNSWAPARKIWNQHPYSITNINDNATVPTNATANFSIYNNYHSAQALAPGETLGDDLQAEIVSLCEEDCDSGWLRVVVRLRNLSTRDLDAGLYLALYARTGSGDVLVEAKQTPAAVVAGKTSEGLVFSVPSELAAGASGLLLRADDNGTGTGLIAECVENDNEFWSEGPFCQ
jgi:hypothetical protein